MARYSSVGAAPRILVLVLLVLVLLVGGTLWFNYLGLIDARAVVAPVASLFGLDRPSDVDPIDDAVLLDSARLAKREQALTLVSEEIARRERGLEDAAAELALLRDEIEAREAELRDREISFNQRVREDENRRARVEQISRNLTGMPPVNAVAILQGFEDQLLIETLQITEQRAAEAGEFSLVPFWLSQFPPQRAAEIQRKMTIRADQ
ncbi:MAG: flagellar protein FlbB [Spirochaetaceae bacterium]|nr:MAG: flagellar protein FlbB [Spirochaetaceae bacterium]